jgi:hypothetical protein
VLTHLAHVCSSAHREDKFEDVIQQEPRSPWNGVPSFPRPMAGQTRPEQFLRHWSSEGMRFTRGGPAQVALPSATQPSAVLHHPALTMYATADPIGLKALRRDHSTLQGGKSPSATAKRRTFITSPNGSGLVCPSYICVRLKGPGRNGSPL